LALDNKDFTLPPFQIAVEFLFLGLSSLGQSVQGQDQEKHCKDSPAHATTPYYYYGLPGFHRKTRLLSQLQLFPRPFGWIGSRSIAWLQEIEEHLVGFITASKILISSSQIENEKLGFVDTLKCDVRLIAYIHEDWTNLDRVSRKSEGDYRANKQSLRYAQPTRVGWCKRFKLLKFPP
jgi:hypothetical protein